MKKSFHTMKILLDLYNLPSSAALEDFVHHVNHFRQETFKIKKEHDERVRVYRVTKDLGSELQNALEQTRADNRTAIIISSLESKFEFIHLRDLVQAQKILYLREYELRWRRNMESRQDCMGEA